MSHDRGLPNISDARPKTLNFGTLSIFTAMQMQEEENGNWIQNHKYSINELKVHGIKCKNPFFLHVKFKNTHLYELVFDLFQAADKRGKKRKI